MSVTEPEPNPLLKLDPRRGRHTLVAIYLPFCVFTLCEVMFLVGTEFRLEYLWELGAFWAVGSLVLPAVFIVSGAWSVFRRALAIESGVGLDEVNCTMLSATEVCEGLTIDLRAHAFRANLICSFALFICVLVSIMVGSGRGASDIELVGFFLLLILLFRCTLYFYAAELGIAIGLRAALLGGVSLPVFVRILKEIVRLQIGLILPAVLYFLAMLLLGAIGGARMDFSGCLLIVVGVYIPSLYALQPLFHCLLAKDIRSAVLDGENWWWFRNGETHYWPQCGLWTFIRQHVFWGNLANDGKYSTPEAHWPERVASLPNEP